MRANKIYRSVLPLLLMLAIFVSCVGMAFATTPETETGAAVTTEPASKAAAVRSASSETIVADWVHDYTIKQRGAAAMMQDYADLGITDVYLLVKGTAGKIGWTSSVAGTTMASNGDILKDACAEAKKHGIRVHAWLMAGHDDHYINNIDANAMAYHFRVGYSSEVNRRLNLRDAGYRAYTEKLVKELVTKYDIAGIHLDCIRYFELYYDWGKNARDELLTNYDITIEQYNAATKAMCKRGGYNYTMKTASTPGYNNGATYSYVAYAASGTSASSNTTFATVLTNSSYGDAYKGAQAFMQLRTDTVAGFVETVKKAAGDGIIISCALMPEPIEDTFYKCLYGQDAEKIGKVTDYITPMAYATQYQKTSSWPASLSEKCAATGANVVTGVQAFNETYVSYASDLNAEIPQVLEKAETVNAKTNYGDILGYAFFRGATMTIGNATYNDSDSTVDLYLSNQTDSSDTKLVLKLQNGMTVDTSKLTNGMTVEYINSNVSGDTTGLQAGTSVSVSTDKKTITISRSGNSVLGSHHSAKIKLAVKGTPSTTYGVLQLTSYKGSSYSEGKSFCVTSAVDAGIYNGIVKGTCAAEHTDIETWTDGDGKHFAFCYNCLTDLTEDCVMQSTTTDGYTAQECVGGLNPTTGKTDVDAHSLNGGCGYSYVATNYVNMHFNADSIANDTGDWNAVAPKSMTASVDTVKGILYGQIDGDDPHASADLDTEGVRYAIVAGDVIEVRIKTTVTEGMANGLHFFFKTSAKPSYNADYVIGNATTAYADGEYHVLQFPFASGKEYIGQTLTGIRIDPLNVDSNASVKADYEVDYIYVGPVAAAPSAQNDTELYFDFTNDTAAMSRYNGITYGGRNFDRNEGYWATASNGNAKNYSVDNDAGTLNVSVDATPDTNGEYDVWIETTTKYGAFPWSSEPHYQYYPLSYNPAKADCVQVRFKLNGCEEVASKKATVSVVYDYVKDGANGALGDMFGYVDMSAEGYQTVTIPVKESFKGADELKSLALRFRNITSASDGTISIDYIYVGPNDKLYFGFENSAEDQQRYTSKTYGDNNFDTGNWAARKISVGSLAFDNEEGTMTFQSKDATQDYHYVQTSTTLNADDAPLRYVPSATDTLQLRFKIENAVVNGDPKISIHYMTGERTNIANSAVTNFAIDESYLDGKYHLVSIPLAASFTDASFISALRVGFSGISSVADQPAKFTIDYIFVGEPESRPIQDSLFFDFEADAAAATRYDTATYGKTYFDTSTNWLLNNIADGTVVNGDLTGTITASSYIRTAINGAPNAESLPLRYEPGTKDYLQLRFKIENSTAQETDLKLYFYVNERNEWDFITLGRAAVDGKYAVVTVPLTDATCTSAERINGLQIAFGDVTDGKLSIDYLYVGAEEKLPIKDQLYFDFGNTVADKERYNEKTYGQINYDDAENLQWNTLTTGIVDGSETIDNANGTLVAGSLNDEITSICVDTTSNLIYNPAEAEIMQSRIKLDGFAKIEGKTPFVTLQFFSVDGVLSSKNVDLTEEQLNTSDYITIAAAITDEIRACGSVNKLRLYFGNVAGDKNSKVTIDFLYVGKEENQPVLDTLYFDFENTEADRARYKTKTYGNINFDIGNWKANELRNLMPTYNSAEGTVSTKVIGTSPYLQTVTDTLAMSSAPLTFKPGEDTNLIQIRMKLADLQPVVEGTNGQLVLHIMTEAGAEVVTDRSLRYSLAAEELNGEFFTANFNVGEYMSGISNIYAIRLTASALCVPEGEEGTMEIDYIYIGSKENSPAGTIYFVDFIGNDGQTTVQHSVVSADGKVSFVGTLPEQEIDENNHYSFRCWTLSDGTVVDLDSYSFDSDATLYPQFNATAHTLKLVSVTDETETTFKMHTCTGCDYSIVTDHIWDEGKITTAASCTATGVKTFCCTLCDETKTEALGATGHTKVVDKAVAATCTSEGKTAGSHCSVCNAIIVAQQPIAALGHSYNSGIITTQPSCTSAGIKTYTCAYCSDTKTETIEAVGHSLSYHAYTAPTCTADGNMAFYACANCDQFFANESATYVLPKDYVVLEAVGHNLGFRKQTAPTCTQIGYIDHYYCDKCSKYYADADGVHEMPASYVETAALGHNEVKDQAVAATCTTEGKSAGSHCSVCNAVIVTQQTIPATGHTRVTDPAVAPTCTQPGKTAGVHCSVCNVVLFAQQVIPAKKHSFTFTDNGANHTIGCLGCDYNVIAEHTYYGGVCLCGAIESAKPKEVYVDTLKATMAISVGSEMSVAFTVNQSMISKYESFYLVVEKDMAGAEPKTVTFGYGEGQTSLNPLPNATNPFLHNASFTGLTVKEMGDEIRATLYAVGADGTLYYGPMQTDSIKDYLMRGLDLATSTAEKKTMYVDMLRYGAVAQTYFQYDTQNLVDADLTEAHMAYATTEIPEAVDNSKAEGGLGTLNTSVVLKARVTLTLSHLKPGANLANMKFVVKDALDGTVIKEIAAYNLNPVMVAADFDDVGAKQMRRLITVTLYDGDKAITDTVTWSVESYVAKVRTTSTDAGQIALLNAMLTYGDAVAAYMATQ